MARVHSTHTQNIFLQHKFNNKEKQLGKRNIRADGWDAQTQTVYQFHGCLLHHIDCPLTAGKTHNPINNKPLAELRQNTENITRYLREDVGVRVYEREWQDKKEQDKSIQQFIQSHFPQNTPFRCISNITEQTILDAIQKESLFALIQYDVRVPESLREHFAELQPIFKNCQIGREEIGPLMKEYAERHTLLSQPRRTLVASYFGEQILLATPLLKWYLEHGLVVDNISLIIEYQPRPCFKPFGDAVPVARRGGDKDPAKAILADTFKLLGNSVYDKALTNVAKHRDPHYVSTEQAQ